MKEQTFIFVIDEASFRKVYDLYFQPICVFLNYYTRKKTMIEDVVQEVFVKLWEDRDSIEIAYIRTYLFNAARNRILNHLRNEQNRTELLTHWAKAEIGNKEGADCYDLDEFSLLLQQAMESLPEKCGEIFYLNKVKKLTYNEIAQLKSISVKTVEAQISTASRRIKNYFKNISVFL